MKKSLIGTALLSALLLLVGLCGHASAEELNLDFKLVNKTGYTISKIYIGPSTQEEWGDNILKEALADGETVDISFDPKATAAKWDIKVIYEDKDTAQWIGLKLTEISKISLFYNADKGTTTAQTE